MAEDGPMVAAVAVASISEVAAVTVVPTSVVAVVAVAVAVAVAVPAISLVVGLGQQWNGRGLTLFDFETSDCMI